MQDTTPDLLALATDFEAPERDEWLALVDKAIKGGDFEKRLVFRTADGLRIEPLYTRPRTPPHEFAAPARAGWDIRTLIVENDPAAANAAILEDLEGGATSIAVQIAGAGASGLAPSRDSMEAALSGVILEMCPVALIPFEAFRDAADGLDRVWTGRGVGEAERLGALNADPLGTLAVTGGLAEPVESSLASAAKLAAGTANAPGVTALLADGVPYHNAGASEAQELAALLATFVAYLRACEEQGLPPSQAFPKIAVSLAADADLFLTIAKMRAARRVLDRVADACGAEGAVRLTSASSFRMMTRRDPWTNVLRCACACAGAALGGADAVLTLPFTFALGKPDRFARRIARNTQLVLQEESNLGRVGDPAAGSWFVESATRDLAAKAWEIFQSIEAKGGVADALMSGWMQDEIAKTAEARVKDVASRKVEITGVSAFPKLGADGVTVEPWPQPPAATSPKAVEVRPLTAARLAALFEALRDAAEKAAPRVFLATLGAIADHTQRSTWTRNLLAAGGIGASSPNGGIDASGVAAAFRESGATVACIASSDAIYAAQAEAAARALKSAGAVYVLMAGKPGDREQALRESGVDAFLFAGQDAVAALTTVHAKLGVAA